MSLIMRRKLPTATAETTMGEVTGMAETTTEMVTVMGTVPIQLHFAGSGAGWRRNDRISGL
jgi:hypothetical protein